jgi:hypothetical protein
MCGVTTHAKKAKKATKKANKKADVGKHLKID